MLDNLRLRSMNPGDPETISRAFSAMGWQKPPTLYEWYLREQVSGELSTLVAELDGAFVGSLVIRWQPSYEPFRRAGIPEVKDLNVLPAFQRRGIASHLMDEAESIVARR